MNFPTATSRPLAAACWLAIAIAVGLLYSPPLANLAELLLAAVVASSPVLRARLWRTCRRPPALASLAFAACVAVGMTYSVAPPAEAWSMLTGWRKLLLLPLALALFEDPRWKQRFVFALVAAAAAGALASFIMWGLDLKLYAEQPYVGVVLRNHSFQSSMLAVAAFAAAVLALEPGRRRGWLIAAALLLGANLALATPGRSGYVMLLVCGLAFAVSRNFLPGRGVGIRVAAAVLVVVTLLAALAAAPTSRSRIVQAVEETVHYDQSRELTSMGIRVIFWQNSLELIRQHALVGVGTGGFGTAYAAHVANKPGLAGTPSGDPHNQYMKIVAEHGLVGLALFLAILVAALREPALRPWRLLGVAVLLAWCATSLANSHFSTFAEGSFIYLWLGVMLAGADAGRGEQV